MVPEAETMDWAGACRAGVSVFPSILHLKRTVATCLARFLKWPSKKKKNINILLVRLSYVLVLHKTFLVVIHVMFCAMFWSGFKHGRIE